MHPGEYLNEVSCSLGLDPGLLATDLRVPVREIEQILAGERDISPEFALRLDRYFGSGIRMWLDLQGAYYLALTKRDKWTQIKGQVQPLEHSAEVQFTTDELPEVPSTTMFECTALSIGVDGGPAAGLSDGMLPIHPGEYLAEEISFFGANLDEWSKAMGIGDGHLRAIVDQQLDIDAETALRLSHFFGTSAEIWMNLQASYSAKVAKRDLGQTIWASLQPRQGSNPRVAQAV